MRNSFSPNRPRERGFTLLEIIIVVTVIGLLVGGVLFGREMIRSVEINRVISDIHEYAAAAATFKEKYQALPGDMANATSYWGTASGGCPNGTGTGTQTCNGNGDGVVFNGTEGPLSADVPEMFRFWQQLAITGLIEGQYSGIVGPAGIADNVVGVNIPETKQGSCGVGLWYLGILAPPYTSGGLTYNAPYWFDGTYNHTFIVGANRPSAHPHNPCFTTQEALALDTKSDDGKPGTGSVVSLKGSNGFASEYCATTNNPLTAVYDQSRSGFQCNIIFRNVF
jgi:prepilin-type N-terminal cleavage/methylation domain-containing protein